MNQDNLRLKEIQREKSYSKTCSTNQKAISDCLTYQGKIEILEKGRKKKYSKEMM